MMQDEYLAEYLNNPGLQAKYGDYGTYRNFMLSQQAGIAPIYNEQVKKSSKEIIQNNLGGGKKRKFVPPSIALLGALLPKEDPVTTASRDYFSGLYGLDSIGRIAEGDLMQGYNPISGGFLNRLTGGKYGQEMNIGLDKAYQKRIDTITKTLQKKDSQQLRDRLAELKDRQRKDALALQKIKLDHASPQQKQTMQDMSTGQINTGMPEQPTPTPSGNVVTGGQSPLGYTTQTNIPDRGRNR